MAKVSPYSLSSVSAELENFRDEVTTLLNYGKYQVPMVTSLPNWAGAIGEEVIYEPSSAGHTSYRYINTAWVSTWSITL